MRTFSIIIGIIIGFFVGEFVMEILFAAIFTINPSDAEGTKYGLYLIFMAFNGAVFGSAIGGLIGFVLSCKCRP